MVLADKFAIGLSNEFDIDDLTIKILKVIRPDIYDNISRMQYFERLLKDSRQYMISNKDFSKITRIPPVRHEKLSTQMSARLKLAHNAIKDVDLRSYEAYEEDFRRSTNIDREIIITELLVAVYLDCINKRKMSLEEKTTLYVHTLSLGNNEKPANFSSNEWIEFSEIIKNYANDINANIVMEYKF
ncbi:hypothetical protein SAMN05446037_103210 [Anaerovirgula multivorans]|uniref:Uncharacterized protein n=1 Tax=Anaerovirgula multivorans TaxID=312168 RepID=A0A239J0Q7_9FIRM|nr:hypothetical protein [Anaerovirgula multivorans]SNS99222.1 hypothetical protein SAMN05446037_103210 [Anaerovirgula multivorans]